MAVDTGVRANSAARRDGSGAGIGSARAALQLIGRIGTRASEATGVCELLQGAVQEVAEAAGFQVGHAYRLDNGTLLATSQTWWVDPEWYLADITALQEASENVAFLAGMGLPGQALGRAEAVWFPDVSDAPSLMRREVALACGLMSAFAFPLLIGGHVVGVLEFFGTSVCDEDPALTEAAFTIGRTLGQVIERIEAHRDQWETQNHAQMILDNAGDAFVAIDGDGIVIGWNRSAEKMFGYTAAEAVGRSMPELIMPPEYREDHDAGVARFKRVGHGRVADQYVELEALRKGGERFPVEMAFWGLNQQGRWHFYSFVRDITERKSREALLVYRTAHDELTGVPNRAAAIDHLTDALEGRRAGGGDIALLLVDLDRFRITKERLGHAATDELLVAVAGRIRAAAAGSGWVARVGDDEFVVVCQGIDRAEAAVGVAERLLGALESPFDLTDDRVLLGASVGVVLSSSGTETPDGLLGDAAAGLSLSRQTLRGAIKVIDGGFRSVIHRRLGTERDLARAIDDGQLRLHYQPVVSFADRRMVGVEALLRWEHPERGLLPPGAFIEIAEESGQIVPIGSWVIAEACRQAAEWKSLGVTGVSIAVNLSARQFTQSGLVSEIVENVRDVGLEPASSGLIFEVTESMLMNDPGAAADTLSSLHDRGFGVSLDDFGTGYSSLAYLKSFAVDTVKIDRSFVLDIDTDPRDRAIVGAVTNLGHALGLEVLAEGIETEAQAARLVDLGCDLAQGYHFGRPMPAPRAAGLVGVPLGGAAELP